MSSPSITPNIGLRIIPTGSAQWGTSVNNNALLMDQAFGTIKNPYKGAWDNLTTYSSGQFVLFNDILYISLISANLGQPPATSTSAWATLQGPEGPPVTFRGEWNEGITYALGDLVSSDGSSYVSLQASNVGVAPESTPSAWGLLAKTGTPGILTGDYDGPLSLESLTLKGDQNGTILIADAGVGFKIMDSAGVVAFAIDEHGDTQVKNLSVLGSLALGGGLTLGGAITALQGIFQTVNLNGALLQMAASDGNAFEVLDESGAVGLAVTSSGEISGSTGSLPPSSALSADLIHVPDDLNQSLGQGQYGTPCLSIASSGFPLYPTNLMFNSGPRCGTVDGSAIASSKLASLVPLVEIQETFPAGGELGETSSSGFAATVSRLLMQYGYTPRILSTINGVGGTAYAQMAPGTTVYNNGLAIANAAKARATASGWTYRIPAQLSNHGQTDEYLNTPPATYTQDLLTIQAAYEAAYRGIAGQGDPVPLIIEQISNWTVYSGASKAVGTIPYAQLAAAQKAPTKVLISHPGYIFPSASDGVHSTNLGYRWRGEYYAKAFVRAMLRLGATAIQPVSAVMLGSRIVVDFQVPVAPLVIDTTYVSEPSFVSGSKYGFEFADGTSSPAAITAVTVMPNGTSVEITLASFPTAPHTSCFIRYAYTGTAGVGAGPTSGPRGNLRDSDNTPSLFGNSLFNYCCHFNMGL